MPVPLVITVTAQDTGTPVAGARVTFRGAAYLTDATGSALTYYEVTDFDGTHLVDFAVIASGYNNFSSPLSSPPGTTLAVSLVPSSASNRYTILVRSSDTHIPLPAAWVYFDSTGAGADSHGIAEFRGDAQAHIVQARMPAGTTGPDGRLYQTSSPTTVSPSGAVTSVVIDLVAGDGNPRQLTLVFDPSSDPESSSAPAPTNGGVVTLTGGFAPENLSIDTTGSVVTVNRYGDGTSLTVGFTLAGWTTFSGPLQVINGLDAYSFQMQKADPNDQSSSGDKPNPGVNDTPKVTVDPANPTPLSPNSLLPIDSYEYIYPSGEFGKYFTTTQARLYIGNLFVDELNFVQFALQANRVPIYGYASRDFDDVGLGRALVQGQLGINFISEGYLYTVLKEFAKLQAATNASPLTDPATPSQQRLAQLQREKSNLLSQLSKPGNDLTGPLSTRDNTRMDGESQPTLTSMDILTRLAAINQEIASIAASGPEMVSGSKKYQLQQFDTSYANAAYLPIPFTLDLHLEGAGRTVRRRLERCYLGANEQILDQSGNVLIDTYSFIARRLR